MVGSLEELRMVTDADCENVCKILKRPTGLNFNDSTRHRQIGAYD